MRRREFIAGLGSAEAWPVAAAGGGAGDRVAILIGGDESDPDRPGPGPIFVLFRANDPIRARNYAAELVASNLDMIWR
jgi:hypothetical protein